jgi:hypothetical protein
MPYELRLNAKLRKAGWKVKIRDAERLEEPHATIIWKYKTWRLSLRTNEFLEQDQSWNDKDMKEVKDAVDTAWETLKTEWDKLYPGNPISSEHDDQGR